MVVWVSMRSLELSCVSASNKTSLFRLWTEWWLMSWPFLQLFSVAVGIQQSNEFRSDIWELCSKPLDLCYRSTFSSPNFVWMKLWLYGSSKQISLCAAWKWEPIHELQTSLSFGNFHAGSSKGLLSNFQQAGFKSRKWEIPTVEFTRFFVANFVGGLCRKSL